jgi:CheY-like chemotaxis protein
MLGGDITVDSVPGKGSLFRLTVAAGPLAGIAMLDDAGRESVARARPQAAPPTVDVQLRGRILLVEEGEDNRRLIDLLLRRAGAETVLASTGKEAVDIVSQTLTSARAASVTPPPFDLILMDVQMPEMDGFQATRALRRMGYRGPIIALTAHAMSGDRERCLQGGFDDYETKPIDRRRFLALVKQYLESRVGGRPPLPSS